MTSTAYVVRPSREDVREHAGPETHVALSTSVRVDLDAPISIFLRLGGAEVGSFLLESVEGGELMGRYTFMGFRVADRVEWDGTVCTVDQGGARVTVRSADPLAVVEEILAGFRVAPAPGLPRFQGGAVGWIGFDCVSAFDRAPVSDRAGVGLPPMRLLLPRDLVVYDHLKHTLTFLTHVALGGDREAAYDAGCTRLQGMVERLAGSTAPPEPPWAVAEPGTRPPASFRSNWPEGGYQAAVRSAREAIAAGEIFQVVLSQRFSVDAAVDPMTLYRALRALNPSPYMFFFSFEDCAIVGSSPEVLVRLDGQEVLVRPIAGTRPRGATPQEDEALAAGLLADGKELAEHRMLVDLGRNDVGRIAATGSVVVVDPLHIERYSHVMHIVTDVRGALAPGRTAFDVFRACFPAGTVSGAPKVRACETLARLEPDRRGVYAGAVGYFDYAGNMDTCIAIRTMVVTGTSVHVQAGAGIVYDSDPAAEDDECRSKARAAFAAIELAQRRSAEVGAAGGLD